MDTKVAQSTRCHFNQSMYAYEGGRGGGGEEEPAKALHHSRKGHH